MPNITSKDYLEYLHRNATKDQIIMLDELCIKPVRKKIGILDENLNLIGSRPETDAEMVIRTLKENGIN